MAGFRLVRLYTEKPSRYRPIQTKMRRMDRSGSFSYSGGELSIQEESVEWEGYNPQRQFPDDPRIFITAADWLLEDIRDKQTFRIESVQEAPSKVSRTKRIRIRTTRFG